MEENLTFNYLALLGCIISEISIDHAIDTIICQKTRRNTSNGSRKQAVQIIDILTNKEFEFTSQSAACNYLGMSKYIIGRYIDNNKIYKKRYYFISKNER